MPYSITIIYLVKPRVQATLLEKLEKENLELWQQTFSLILTV